MTFDELNLNKPLLNALSDMACINPTTIQERSFSAIMSGKDLIGIAQTGTGKTLAYLLPCLRLWSFSKEKMPQILVLVPTRELVVQVVKVVEDLSKYMSVKVVGAYGGTNIKTQIHAINEGVDVMVATPGRLLDLVLNGSLRLKNIKKLIIDEVDEMLTLGFRKQLTDLFELIPAKRQNLMFSATITDEIEVLIKDFFNSPIKIEAAPTGTPLENIVQKAYHVPNFNTKINLLKLLLADKEEYNKVLVFCESKKMADEVYDLVNTDYFGQIGVIHSNKSQNNRFDTVKKFQGTIYRVLIATDLISRGLDISEVSHVINFDTHEVPENYMHRIGRTGRAKEKGIAISFITPSEAKSQEQIESLMNYQIPMLPLPENLLISDVLTPDEMPKVQMKNVLIKIPKREDVGPAFHPKKEKNLKVYNHKTRAEKMKEKYGKPKTRGQKKK
jgi:ATP-dependent RNA helicase RhlE